MFSSKFEERFQKSPFSRLISAGGKPNCRNKAAFFQIRAG